MLTLSVLSLSMRIYMKCTRTKSLDLRNLLAESVTFNSGSVSNTARGLRSEKTAKRE